MGVNDEIYYNLTSIIFKVGSIDSHIQMEESLHCDNKVAKQQIRLQAEEVALTFANIYQTGSVERASDYLQIKWDQMCEMPRGTKAERKEFMIRVIDFYEALENHSEIMRSVLMD